MSSIHRAVGAVSSPDDFFFAIVSCVRGTYCNPMLRIPLAPVKLEGLRLAPEICLPQLFGMLSARLEIYQVFSLKPLATVWVCVQLGVVNATGRNDLLVSSLPPSTVRDDVCVVAVPRRPTTWNNAGKRLNELDSLDRVIASRELGRLPFRVDTVHLLPVLWLGHGLPNREVAVINHGAAHPRWSPRYRRAYPCP